MATLLDRPLKRELEIDGQPYMLTITPDGVKITMKGRRLGREMSWRNLLSGDAELTSQLLRSVSDITTKRSGTDKGLVVKPGKVKRQTAKPSSRRKGR